VRLQNLTKKYGDGIFSKIGYQDFQINQDTLFVSYIDGSSNGTLANAVNNMNRRAREACLERGFSSYELMDRPVNATSGDASSYATMHSGQFSYSVATSSQPTAQSYVHCVK
jgi:hypothetical protein